MDKSVLSKGLFCEDGRRKASLEGGAFQYLRTTTRLDADADAHG